MTTRRAAAREMRRAKVTEEMPEFPPGQFRVLYAEPPLRLFFTGLLSVAPLWRQSCGIKDNSFTNDLVKIIDFY